MAKGDEEQILMVLHRSRKTFFIEYLCGVVLLGLLLAVTLQGVRIPLFIRYILVGFSVFCFLFAEINRLILRYKITPTKVITLHGFIKQSKKNIYFHPLAFVPDINIKQSRMQRLFNYGTVFLSGGGTGALELKDVDHPEEVMEMIEHLIDQNKKSQTRTIPGSER